MIENIKTYEGMGLTTTFQYKNLTISLHQGQRNEENDFEPYFHISVWDTEEGKIEEKDLRETWDEKKPNIRWRTKFDDICLDDAIREPYLYLGLF